MHLTRRLSSGCDTRHCPGDLIVRSNNLKLAINLFERDELYDLGTDTLELTNLIDDPAYADRRDAMHQEIVEWMCRHCDAFRGKGWAERPGRREPVRAPRHCSRPTPHNGLDEEALNYNTGEKAV